MKAYVRPAIIVLALAALGASIAALYVHYKLVTSPGYSSFCDISATVSCQQVLESSYGRVAGIPVAAGGAIWSALVLLLGVFGLRQPKSETASRVASYIFVLATLGLAGATAMLSDGQIVAVLLEANAGEVHTADVADARATDGDVRTFSMQIRSDHSAAAMRLNALVQSQGFTVADSPQRQMVAASANDVVDTLWMSSMNQFDRTFAQAQVMLHTSTLNLIDDVLLPQVDNPALRSEVQVERAAVAMHLSEAQALSAALATSSGAGGAGGAAGAGGAGGAGGR